MIKKVWLWDEYDEIWGFDMVPEGFPDYYMHAEALRLIRCHRTFQTTRCMQTPCKTGKKEGCPH
eukprot:12560439-Heterocapsa_arctica.AAC.1